MKIFRGFSTRPTREMKDPLLEENGIWFELRGGDICDPFFGNWFNPPWPKYVFRAFCKLAILPWISWKIGAKGGYIGFKAYGVDPEAYKNWLPADEVYEGSNALCFSIRPFATIK